MKYFLIIVSFFAALGSFAGLSPEERKSLFQAAKERLQEKKLEEKVPKVGEKFPDLILDGKKVSAWLKKGPLVITFYRGGWCPYCVKQLKEINSSIKEIDNGNSHLIALSPEQQKEVEKTKRKNNLNFTLLSDPQNTLAKTLNLTYKVEPAVAEEYKALGIDLALSQGNENYELPMPATFVIGKNQIIAFSFADSDYTKRASTEEIIRTLKQLVK